MTAILNDEAEILNGVEELLLGTDETTEAERTEDVHQMPEAVTTGEKTEAENTVLPQTKIAVTNKKQWSRRLVIVTGDKGGVGKSTFARGLAQTYLDMKKEFLAFDADISNSHLNRFYGDQCLVRKLDFFTEGNVDIFLDDLKELIEDSLGTKGEVVPGKSLFLLELPPQSMRILRDVVEQMKFLSTVEELYDMRVTIVVVISRVMDSVRQLTTLYDFCQDQVDYVVVKNLFFGSPENFVRYKESSDVTTIKDLLKEREIPFLEITMPDLIEHAYDYLDKNSLTFNQGIEQKEKPSVKGRVSTWISKFKEQVGLARSILGLNDVPHL
ncbi:hypothetical protein ANSO36C_63350 (plasmid) [Nostoc cf. commune SO-36]|uniref:CobQ/CobB/MinD/ParA nucleotide binding domain-containing protein n=1 Tax=Nostoc cf. commune SO-36 TaxID=449208 RepID=A0ABN6QBH0_NOSCO|nr:hypothetical protein [Nostoc commune]BDI20533.1 hypothetical protein ANSO36C_63350 [Nostoc cf. commune SO-36]